MFPEYFSTGSTEALAWGMGVLGSQGRFRPVNSAPETYTSHPLPLLMIFRKEKVETVDF